MSSLTLKETSDVPKVDEQMDVEIPIGKSMPATPSSTAREVPMAELVFLSSYQKNLLS